jgi:nitroreductase/NAD-dependent dihydropyrimidine dehydrogenase PreA subunit
MENRPTVSPAQQRALYGRLIAPPEVDVDTCTGCGTCTTECPQFVFELREKKSTVVAGDNCLACGHCWAVCPERAVTQEASSAPDAEDFPAGPPLSSDALESFLAQRRSVRTFEKKEISREVLDRVVGAAGFAPTASNRQDVGLIVVPTPDKLEELRKLTEAFFEGTFKMLGNPLLGKAASLKFGADTITAMGVYAERMRYAIDNGRKSPYFILPFGSALILAHGSNENTNGAVNSALALHSCGMVAQAEGLGSCYLGFVIFGANRDKGMQQFLGLPKGHTAHCAIVLGYPKNSYLRPVKRPSPSAKWV